MHPEATESLRARASDAVKHYAGAGTVHLRQRTLDRQGREGWRVQIPNEAGAEPSRYVSERAEDVMRVAICAPCSLGILERERSHGEERALGAQYCTQVYSFRVPSSPSKSFPAICSHSPSHIFASKRSRGTEILPHLAETTMQSRPSGSYLFTLVSLATLMARRVRRNRQSPKSSKVLWYSDVR